MPPKIVAYELFITKYVSISYKFTFWNILFKLIITYSNIWCRMTNRLTFIII